MFHNLLVIFSVLTLIGCSSSFLGSSVQDKTVVHTPQMSVELPKDRAVNIISPDHTIIIGNTKLAFFEKQKPKSGESAGGYTASLSGTLRVEGNCVVVIPEYGDAVQPIFASYTVAWNNTSNILTYNRKQYRDGDYINLAGGFIPNTMAETITSKNIPNCPHSTLFIVNG